MDGPESTLSSEAIRELLKKTLDKEKEERKERLEQDRKRRDESRAKRETKANQKEHVDAMKKEIENIDGLTLFLMSPEVDGLKLFYWMHVAGKPRATLWISKRPKVCAEVKEAISYTMPMQVFSGGMTKAEGCIHDLIYSMDEAKEYFEEIKEKLEKKYEIDLADDEVIRALMCAHKKSGIGRITQEPKILSWDVGTVCSQYFNPNEWLKDGDYPLWTEFMSRFTSPTATPKFMAWVWSIFEENDPLRCACHIQGPANSGKSALARTLSAITKDFCMAVNGESFNNQFSAAKLYTKRVATWDDCRDFYYVTKELIHSALGGGMVDVERKGESSFSAKLHIKLLVMSNYPPKLEDEENMRSRMLYLKVRGRGKDCVIDPTYDQKLQVEFPCFLKACKEMYDTTIVDGKMPEETHHLIECFTMEQTIFDDMCVGQLSFHPEFSMEQKDMKKHLQSHLRKHQMDVTRRKDYFTFHAFERYLFDKWGVTIGSVNRRTCYLGVKPTSELTEEEKAKVYEEEDEVVI